jgi:hypothetical protein
VGCVWEQEELENDFVALQLVDPQPVWLKMAFAAVEMIACKYLVVIA